MDSPLKYIEDKIVMFDMNRIFQRKMRMYDENTIHGIVSQIVLNIDELPKKDYFVQDMCSVIKRKNPFFYRIDYLNENNDIPVFVNIEQITLDEYLDAIDKNKYFKQTDYYE